MASPSNGNARQRCRWLSNPVSRRAAAQKAPTTPPQPISFDYGRGAPVRGRDGAFDPGGATASRITMPHVCFRRFRASRPPQRYLFRRSIPHPIRSLCTLRVRRPRPASIAKPAAPRAPASHPWEFGAAVLAGCVLYSVFSTKSLSAPDSASQTSPLRPVELPHAGITVG